jgi:hypothetical protein
VGIWRYHNATASTATINVSIAGVAQAQAAYLIFSNGQPTDAAALPAAGLLAASAGTPAARADSVSSAASVATRSGHLSMLERNQAFARSLILNGPVRKGLHSNARANAPAVTPAIGTTRTWIDLGSAPSTYNMQVGATCALMDGRNAVFWIDSAQLASGAVTLEQLGYLVTPFCGPGGAYARLTNVVGSPWGPGASAYANLIQDGPGALQDINIVVPGVPQSTSWGGYFSAGNFVPASIDPGSNGALAIFLNGWVLSVTKDPGGSFVASSLIHELKHLINFYQRDIVRRVSHATWLEETSAMLAEDFVTPAVLPYSRTNARHNGYADSGGGTGYLGWTDPGGNSYNLGATFGGFLHRRYGLNIDRRLMDTFADDGSPLSSYLCVDSIIARSGGNGFEDEFDRMGASVFGSMAVSGVPDGFGFPSVSVEGYSLDPLDSAMYRYSLVRTAARPLSQGFLATLHTYQIDTITPGQTTYGRNGVAIPAGTTLVLVIQ